MYVDMRVVCKILNLNMKMAFHVKTSKLKPTQHLCRHVCIVFQMHEFSQHDIRFFPFLQKP